jgi:hypothetical protein
MCGNIFCVPAGPAIPAGRISGPGSTGNFFPKFLCHKFTEGICPRRIFLVGLLLISNNE